MKSILFLFLFWACAFRGMAAAPLTNVFHVAAGSASPAAPYATWATAAADIQSAVDAASAVFEQDVTDCVVLVSNGTYMLTAPVTITNGVTLRSVNGRDETVLDGQYPALTNRCLLIADAAGVVTVDGFTIQNGLAFSPRPTGGGILVTNSQASILNCAFVRNRAGATGVNGYGGGLGVVRSAGVLVTNCLFLGNTNTCVNTGTGGGGALFLASRARVLDCQAIGNSAGNSGQGGGIGVELLGSGLAATDVLVSNCLFTGNSGLYGGGIYLGGGILLDSLVSNNLSRNIGGGVTLFNFYDNCVSNCVITRNQALGDSGGISINRGHLFNSRITHNYAVGNGGALNNSEAVIRNCLFAGNQAGGRGGAIYWGGSGTKQMANCTITRNAAALSGGGIHYAAATYFTFTNNIIHGNQAPVSNDLAGVTTLYYSCAPELAAGVNGNITADPLFMDNGSGYGTNAVLGDYRLQSNSPCIGAGTNLSWMTAYPKTDLEGNARIRPSWGRVDMGAHEAYPAAGPLTNGFTVSPAAGAAPLAVTLAGETSGDTNGLMVRWDFGDGTDSGWLPGGVLTSHTYAVRTIAYTVTMAVSNGAGESASRTLADAVMVYPAFVHVATGGLHLPPFETWENAATNIQSAVDAAGSGFSTVLISNGLYVVRTHVVVSKAVTVRSVSGDWNDVTVQGGYPTSTNRVFVLGVAGATLEGLTVTNGRLPAAQHGGGVFMTNGIVRRCRVIGNATTQYHGGGIFLQAGRVEDCLVLNNNTGNQTGGGIAVDGPGIVVRCVVAGNTAAGGVGGGISVEDGGQVIGCVISNNSARIGGGVYHRLTAVAVSNCVIVGNTASQLGGGVGMLTTVGQGLFRNCLIGGNTAVSNGGGVMMAANGPRFENCTIVGNQAGVGGGWHQAAAGTGVNCIVYFNLSTNAAAVFNDVTSTATNALGAIVTNLFFSCSPALATAGGSGNVNGNPLFAQAGNGFGSGWTAGDYHLKAGSPAIDSGTSLAWMAAAEDLEGESRVLGVQVNMGAYEKPVPGRRGAVLLVR